VEKGSSGNLIHMMIKGAVAIENDSKFADVWGGGQGGVIDEAEVRSGFGEGFVTDHVSFITLSLRKLARSLKALVKPLLQRSGGLR